MDPASLKRGNDPNHGIRIEMLLSSKSSKSKTPSANQFITPPQDPPPIVHLKDPTARGSPQ